MLPRYQTIGGMLRDTMGQSHANALKDKLIQEQIKNALIANKYAEPKMQSDIASKNAATQHQNIFNRLPFGGKTISGSAGESLGLKMLKDEFGPDSAEYQNALNKFNLTNDKTRQLMQYQQSLQESLPKRNATPLAKQAMEEEELESGILPGSSVGGGQGQRISPEKQQDLTGRFDLKKLKDTTDPKTRERVLFASNMEKTIQNINPDDLTHYSGPEGRVKLLRDATKSSVGNSTPEYKAYKKSMKAAKLLSKQVRQFYGDSIQPSVGEQLDLLTNPSTWSEHPEVAKELYNTFVGILNQEADTYHDALKSADVYKKPKRNDNLASLAASATKQPSGSLVQPKFPKNDPLGIR